MGSGRHGTSSVTSLDGGLAPAPLTACTRRKNVPDGAAIVSEVPFIGSVATGGPPGVSEARLRGADELTPAKCRQSASETNNQADACSSRQGWVQMDVVDALAGLAW